MRQTSKNFAFFNTVIVLVVVFCIFTSTSAYYSGLNGQRYNNSVVLDNAGNVVLHWQLESSANSMLFEVVCRTRGYVGIGFSPNGGMPGSDFAIGWIDSSGTVHLHDYNLMGQRFPGRPVLDDTQQDYQLISGRKNATHTRISFRRPLNTCDDKDWEITEDTTRILWAYHNQVPRSASSFPKHGPRSRGSRSVHLLDQQLSSANRDHMGPNVTAMEFLTKSVRLPSDYHTLYWCTLFKMPKRSEVGKQHLIRFEPVIQKGSEPYVHHMILYSCDRQEDLLHFVGKGERCFDRNGKSFSFMYTCTSKNVAGWAVGGQAQYFPDNVGYPLFESDEDQYFMLEVHYDNSAYSKDVIDSSGMRIYTTSNLRLIEADTWQLGTPVGAKYNVIPPDQSRFVNYGYCNADCTNKLPPEGVLVYSGMLHTHLAGRKVTVRHIRNGVELEPLVQDKHYDFNYQENRMKKTPVRVYPGDELVVECEFDTSNRNTTTFGGYSTADEMCNAYIGYYPRVKTGFVFCGSSPSASESFAVLGAHRIDDVKPVFRDEFTHQVIGIRQWVNRYVNWTRRGLVQRYQDEVRNGLHYVVCQYGKTDEEKLAAQEDTDYSYSDADDYDWYDSTIWNMEFYPQMGFPYLRVPYVKNNPCTRRYQGK